MDLKTRTKQSVLRLIRLRSALPKSTEARVIGKQLVRSGTSAGGPHQDATRARSDAGFIIKIGGGRQVLDKAGYCIELFDCGIGSQGAIDFRIARGSWRMDRHSDHLHQECERTKEMTDPIPPFSFRLHPFPLGTQVVTLKDVVGQNGRTLHPRGAVGVIVKSPSDLEHSYRVRFPDGVEEALKSGDLTTLAKFKEGDIGESGVILRRHDLFENVIFQCVIGSQAYGLADSKSDIDRRGCYLPPAELHWSLYGVPEQLDCHETQESYWELQKFLILALKANPNVLECLYTPLVEKTTTLADELLSMRSMFLSRLVYQTYNGYVMSQFKKMQADIRNQGKVKWKHVMHLIRLLISGISVLRDGFVPVRVDEHREQLLAIRRGEVPWEETEKLRLSLHSEFDKALEKTKLPERPDYERANAFLIRARRGAVAEGLT